MEEGFIRRDTGPGDANCRLLAAGVARWKVALLFPITANDSVIARMPGSNGGRDPLRVVPVIGASYKAQFDGWAVTGNELVFIGRPEGTRPAAIRVYNVTTRKLNSVLELTEVFLDRGDIGISVSKDGKSILYPQLDRSGSNVIVAEKSRP
jgi:hypothetical protein